MAESKDEFLKILGSNIKRLRTEIGMNQTELAAKCGSDKENNRSGISKIECGKNDVPISKLNEIAKALNVDVCELIKGTEYLQKQMLLENLLKSTYGDDIKEIIESLLKLDDSDRRFIKREIANFLQDEKYKKELLNEKAIS